VKTSFLHYPVALPVHVLSAVGVSAGPAGKRMTCTSTERGSITGWHAHIDSIPLPTLQAVARHAVHAGQLSSGASTATHASSTKGFCQQAGMMPAVDTPLTSWPGGSQSCARALARPCAVTAAPAAAAPAAAPPTAACAQQQAHVGE
jgi:hypothetical protein